MVQKICPNPISFLQVRKHCGTEEFPVPKCKIIVSYRRRKVKGYFTCPLDREISEGVGGEPPDFCAPWKI